ncbi:MAG TPA: hypothetical protein VLR52_00710 [Bacteroidales bacterium]|nr:hypothetical protein [Bacteroidales bacterium]
MFSKIRSFIGNYFFRKELADSGRDRKMTNLREAKHIGILYTLDDVPDYDRVEALVSQLQHDHKDVKAIGFVKNKNLISRFLPKLSYDFFSGKDMNWFYKPVSQKVRDFMAKEFDILIDLSQRDNLPLKYIAGLSMSLCRVGRFTENNTDCYDLMINVDDKTSINDYIVQVTHYLTVINQHAANS